MGQFPIPVKLYLLRKPEALKLKEQTRYWNSDLPGSRGWQHPFPWRPEHDGIDRSKPKGSSSTDGVTDQTKTNWKYRKLECQNNACNWEDWTSGKSDEWVQNWCAWYQRMQVEWIGKMKLTTGETVFFSSREDGIHRSGVAIIMSKFAEAALMEWRPINDRIITARYHSKFIKLTIYYPCVCTNTWCRWGSKRWVLWTATICCWKGEQTWYGDNYRWHECKSRSM